MIQQVGAAHIERERARLLLVFIFTLIPGIQFESPAEIHVEMDRARHRSQIARDIAIDRVGGKQAEACAVDAGPGNGSVGRPVSKVSVAVVVRTPRRAQSRVRSGMAESDFR